MREPRILLADFESSPYVGVSFDRWDTRLHVTQNKHLMSFAWKWLGDDDAQVLSLRSFKDHYRRKANRADDSKLIAAFHKLHEEADLLVFHNGDKFDIKKAQDAYFRHGLRRPSKTASVDTLKVLKRHTLKCSNRLGDVCDELGIGDKLPHTGMQLWLDCMAGDSDAWDLMEKYNLHDVDPLQEGLYLYLRDNNWIDNHPNMSAIVGRIAACPTCAQDGPWVKNGFTGNTRQYQRVVFKDCGHEAVNRNSVPYSAPVFVKRG